MPILTDETRRDSQTHLPSKEEEEEEDEGAIPNSDIGKGNFHIN